MLKRKKQKNQHLWSETKLVNIIDTRKEYMLLLSCLFTWFIFPLFAAPASFHLLSLLFIIFCLSSFLYYLIISFLNLLFHLPPLITLLFSSPCFLFLVYYLLCLVPPLPTPLSPLPFLFLLIQPFPILPCFLFLPLFLYFRIYSFSSLISSCFIIFFFCVGLSFSPSSLLLLLLHHLHLLLHHSQLKCVLWRGCPWLSWWV